MREGVAVFFGPHTEDVMEEEQTPPVETEAPAQPPETAPPPVEPAVAVDPPAEHPPALETVAVEPQPVLDPPAVVEQVAVVEEEPVHVAPQPEPFKLRAGVNCTIDGGQVRPL